MKYVSVTGLDRPLSRIIHGLSDYGGDKDSAQLLDGIYELGCNTFDVARDYDLRCGAEKNLGAWVRARPHNKITIISKAAHPTSADPYRVTPMAIVEDLDRSLETLGLDSLDILLLHRDDSSQPYEPLLEALNDCRRQGKIKIFGVSNWTWPRLSAANSYAQQKGLQGFSVSSSQLSLATCNPENWPGSHSLKYESREGELPEYIRSQFPLFAWSSLAAGYFSQSSSKGPSFQKHQKDFYDSAVNRKRRDRLWKMADRRSCTPNQLALAYLFHLSPSIFAVTGTTQLDHFKENVKAFTIELSAAEIDWLDLRSDAL